MDFAKLMAGLKAAATATEEIVGIMHPQGTEAVKVAAGFELFNVLASGIHAIMTAGNAPTAPASQAPVVAADPAPVVMAGQSPVVSLLGNGAP